MNFNELSLTSFGPFPTVVRCSRQSEAANARKRALSDGRFPGFSGGCDQAVHDAAAPAGARGCAAMLVEDAEAIPHAARVGTLHGENRPDHVTATLVEIVRQLCLGLGATARLVELSAKLIGRVFGIPLQRLRSGSPWPAQHVRDERDEPREHEQSSPHGPDATVLSRTSRHACADPPGTGTEGWGR